jgi:hypothetical protein
LQKSPESGQPHLSPDRSGARSLFGAKVVIGILFAAQGALAQPLSVSISGNAASHQLTWNSRADRSYQIFYSSNLVSWFDSGFFGGGNGNAQSTSLSSQLPLRFYQVREVSGTVNNSFLLLPAQGQRVDLIDGVCFSFNLGLFAQLPGKIRIHQRPPDGTWTQIGAIADFAEIDGIKFVRGSTAWVPDAAGDFELRVEVVDAGGLVIGQASRTVSVGQNQAPTITITGGPASPSATAQTGIFTTSFSDPENDPVRRVEFFDNGVLIGFDRTAPFGDQITDLEGHTPTLGRGTHSITARAFDSRRAVGESATPFVVEITGGNAHPELTVTAPMTGTIVEQGQTFQIVYQTTDADGANQGARVDYRDLAYPALRGSGSASLAPIAIDTTGWELGTHTLSVTAIDPVGGVSHPVFLNVFITGDAGLSDAEQFVANIVDESTAAPTNQIFQGVRASSGFISSGVASGLQIDNGVLLTTGSFSLWNGGDDGFDEDEEEKDWGEQGDRELENRIAGRLTRDAAALEFDVFCANGQLEIEYQFGSEEYDEFVGFFNDGFMVTVDGVLVSFVPDCSGIVAVNSINSVEPVNEHLYLDDDDDIDPAVAPGNQAFQVEYDGMTIRLKAHALVTPNRFHRIRMVIADVNDGRYDSGLVIREGSVRTVAPGP